MLETKSWRRIHEINIVWEANLTIAGLDHSSFMKILVRVGLGWRLLRESLLNRPSTALASSSTMTQPVAQLILQFLIQLSVQFLVQLTLQSSPPVDPDDNPVESPIQPSVDDPDDVPMNRKRKRATQEDMNSKKKRVRGRNHSKVPKRKCTQEMKEILKNGEWLTDEHILLSQELLSIQFPQIDGLQLPLLAENDGFSPVQNEAIQSTH